MRQLPQLERRPTEGYELGAQLARRLFSPSFAANLVRVLAGLATLLGLITVSRYPLAGVAVVAGLAGLGASIWMQRRGQGGPRRNAPAVSWTAEELEFAERVTAALRSGTLGELPLEAVGVDYGTVVTDLPTGAETTGAVAHTAPVIVAQPLRRKHQLTIGGSGSGKSKLLATQAGQAAVLGASLLVIDPHEELAHDMLCSAAPILAARGCALIWPAGPDPHLLPWNPLWTGPGREAWQAADLVVAAIKRVWELSDANTFIIDVLRHTAWALAAAGWTLLEGSRFLIDEPFRAYITERADVPEVSRWVAAYDALHPRDRQGLTQTTLVRLNRLAANPHICRLVGCGVTDPRYAQALHDQGLAPIGGVDLCALINAGVHIFAVLPMRALGEDQYVVAGLVQSALLTAALARQPNDPAMPETEAYLDEAGAYANAQGLGKLLAQARKYKLSAVVAMQDPAQAEPDLVRELKTNTAIKTVFGTDNDETAAWAARSVFGYDPLHVKIDVRERVKAAGQQREQGTFQTYGPEEQQAYWASQVLQLPPRHYVLKVKGAPEPLLVFSPDYTARYTLMEALQLLGRRRLRFLPTIAEVDAELAARSRWLDEQGYQYRPSTEPLPDLGTVSPASTADQDEREGTDSAIEEGLSFGGSDG